VGKSLGEVRRERLAKYYPNGLPTYDDFKVGDPVKIITPMQDFRFFNYQTGTVTKNTKEYLGINVKFDEPMKYENGYILEEYNFEASDLVKLRATRPQHKKRRRKNDPEK
jgi:hypothetical protein